MDNERAECAEVITILKQNKGGNVIKSDYSKLCYTHILFSMATTYKLMICVDSISRSSSNSRDLYAACLVAASYFYQSLLVMG